MKFNTKSKKVNKAWLHDHMNDPYVKLAQREGYRARAAYKLKEIDETLGLFKPGQIVVDLGSAPGAWSQYLRRRFAPRTAGAGGAAVGELDGAIIALDVLPHALAVDVVTLTLSMVRGFGVRTLLVDPKDRFAPQLALWREIIGEHIAARLRSGRAPDKLSRSPR